MPNIKSAAKRVETSEIARQRNRAEKTRIHSQRQKFLTATESTDKDATMKEFRMLVSLLDRAAKKGILKVQTADRQKSRAAARLNKLSVAAT